MLPLDPQARKAIPIYSGFIKYFPRGIIKVAELSAKGNEQHNPGSPLHWDRSKSGDEKDALMRHIVDDVLGEGEDVDGVLHATKMAWRAMANLEKVLETIQDELEDAAMLDASAQDIGDALASDDAGPQYGPENPCSNYYCALCRPPTEECAGCAIERAYPPAPTYANKYGTMLEPAKIWEVEGEGEPPAKFGSTDNAVGMTHCMHYGDQAVRWSEFVRNHKRAAEFVKCDNERCWCGLV